MKTRKLNAHLNGIVALGLVILLIAGFHDLFANKDFGKLILFAIGLFLFGAVNTKRTSSLGTSDITFTEIMDQWGEFYINQGQNMANLYHKVLAKRETEALLTPMVTEDTVLRDVNVEMAEVLQGFQPNWTPKATMTFKPVEIPLYEMKVDQDLKSSDLHKLTMSYLGFMRGSDNDPAQWPILRYYLERLFDRLNNDIEMKAIYKGIYIEPTTNTPGPAINAMNGLEYLVNYWIDAGRTSTIATGALSADPATFVGQVNDFIDGVDELYWDVDMKLMMSKVNYKKYCRGYLDLFHQDYAVNARANGGAIDLSNQKIVGVNSMFGSDKLIMTPKDNVVCANKNPGNEAIVRIESEKRNVHVFTSFFKGVGFILPEIIFTNDVELTYGGF